MVRTYVFLLFVLTTASTLPAQIGVGAKAPKKAALVFDGSRASLDKNWTYWAGPRLSATLPIKWQIVADPVNHGATAVSTNDPAAAGGKYGAADIVTKKAYRDFRLHIEYGAGRTAAWTAATKTGKALPMSQGA